MLRMRDSLRSLVAALFLLAAAPAVVFAEEPTNSSSRRVYPAFDLTYMPEIGPQGLIGFRPAEIARFAKGPELQSITQMFFMLLQQFLPDANLEGSTPPDFANIEQFVLSLQLHVTNTKDGHGSFMLGGQSPCVIRTIQPYDWEQLLRQWFPKATVKRHAGRPYLCVSVHVSADNEGESQEVVFAFYLPDARTMACGTEDEIIGLLDRRAARKPALAPPPGWNDVNRDFAALVLDLREERPISGRFPAKFLWGRDLAHFIDSCETVAFGLGVGSNTRVRLVGATKDASDARTAVKYLRRLIRAANDGLSAEETDVMRTFARDLLKGVAIESNGPRFTLTTTANRNVLELLTALLHGAD